MWRRFESGTRVGVWSGGLSGGAVGRGGGGGGEGVVVLPLLLRLIKTAPTFLLNHPTSQRTKHFYQCLYLGKQWQVGCQGPPWPCCRRAALQGPPLSRPTDVLPLLRFHKWRKRTHTCWLHGNECRAICAATYDPQHTCRHTLLPLGVVWWLRCDPRGPALLTGPWWSELKPEQAFVTQTNKIIIFMHF